MISFQLLCVFFMIGVGAFGGGYVVIPMIEHEVVASRGWITLTEFTELIAVAQMTPGPIGVNAATYTGFKTAGWTGAAAATAGFTLPSVILCSALLWLLSRFGNAPWIDTLKKSVSPAVVGLIIAAVLTYGRASLTDTYSLAFAAAAFIILMLSRGKIHPIALILCGGLAGIFVYGNCWK